MKRSIIYLATPYSHKEAYVKHQRFLDVTKVSAMILKQFRQPNFSPISQSHYQAEIGGLKGTWDFWRLVDIEFLKRCDELWVLTLDGWETSIGVTAEVAYAKRNNIPVKYLSFDGKALDIAETPEELLEVVS